MTAVVYFSSVKLALIVKFNTPFSGSLVPNKYYQKNNLVESLMIEVNRGLYMNEENGEINSNYMKVKSDLSSILEVLSPWENTWHRV